MANTYTHRIVSLKKSNGYSLNEINSFVIEITASNGTNQISSEYTIELEKVPEIQPSSFIEYENIQESDLITWYKNNHIEKNFLTKDIDKKLQKHIQDTVESNFPWS